MIYISSDHRSYKLKQKFINFLDKSNIKYKDVGCFSEERINYNGYVKDVVKCVLSDDSSKGIVMCGSGMGPAIQANRYKGIRAVVCQTPQMAKRARMHNDINVLSIGSEYVSFRKLKKIFEVFMTTKALGEPYLTRNMLMDQD